MPARRLLRDCDHPARHGRAKESRLTPTGDALSMCAVARVCAWALSTIYLAQGAVSGALTGLTGCGNSFALRQKRAFWAARRWRDNGSLFLFPKPSGKGRYRLCSPIRRAGSLTTAFKTWTDIPSVSRFPREVSRPVGPALRDELFRCPSRVRLQSQSGSPALRRPSR